MPGYGFNTGLDGRRVEQLTEEDAEQIAEGLTMIYGEARETMLKHVASRLARGIHQTGWAEKKADEVMQAHAQLERSLQTAQRQRTSLLANVMERAYATGNAKFGADMRSILGQTAHLSPNGIKAGYILADLNNSLNAAERRILRQFDDRYADIIGAVSSKMATGVTTTRQAVGEALQDFADHGITGFVDRGGHHWTLESYSEMAVLTAIERSTLAGYVDTMQGYGYDLAIIDGHAGSCPICEAWEGVIVSVSGNDPNYPSLDEAEGAGVFHPRCLHGITTYYPDISRAPAGGFRDEPREVRGESPQYTARSKQRYMERMIRKYKDRLIVAMTPLQQRQAANKVRQWQDALDEMIERQPEDDYLYRHKGREQGTVKNGKMSAKRITSWPAGDGGITAEQLQDLTSYAEAKGINFDANSFKRFEGSEQSVREVIDAISSVSKDFPLLSSEQSGVILSNSYAMSDDDYAATSGRTIFINNNAFRNAKALEKSYSERVSEHYFAQGSTSKSIGYHEAGHAVKNIYRLPLRVTDGVDPLNISRYALKGKEETIAESFSAHYSGADVAESLTIVERCANIASERE